MRAGVGYKTTVLLFFWDDGVCCVGVETVGGRRQMKVSHSL